MLTQINLDNEAYEKILTDAINTAGRLYPEWTNFNYQDPGITLLELFALMKESQQYFLDQVGDENREKFLKLLGMRRLHRRPAEGLLCVMPEEEFLLPEKCQFLAGDLVFESKERKQLASGDVQRCLFVRDGKLLGALGRGQMEFGSYRFPPFGDEPVSGDVFYVQFPQPLAKEKRFSLYLNFFNDGPIPRNPVEEEHSFRPLVKISFEYLTEGGWRSVSDLTDETCGFLFSGFISFVLKEPMKQMDLFGEKGYFLRAVLEEGIYDSAPELGDISLNVCKVCQKNTKVEHHVLPVKEGKAELFTQLSRYGLVAAYRKEGELYYPSDVLGRSETEGGGMSLSLPDEGASDYLLVCFDWDMADSRQLGIGNGFPSQEIDLERTDILWESLSILVAEPMEEGAYRLWEKVEDFGNSTPEDYHFVFDSERGILRFGDGIHGIAPEGEILLAGLSFTAGSLWNVKKGKISSFRMPDMPKADISNPQDAGGGKEGETFDECFLRAEHELRSPDCAVTVEDFESRVKKTPGLMIEGCKIMHIDDVKLFEKNVDESDVHILIKPYGYKRGKPVSPNYFANIRGYMENYRQVGSGIQIYLPEFVDIEVYIDVFARPQYRRLLDRLRAAVAEYFTRFKNQFGGTISYSALYGYIDSQSFVTEIRSLSIDAKGNGVRHDRDGDIRLSPNSQVVLTRVRASYTLEE